MITEGDACFIAERIFLMKEANPDNIWKRNISLQDRIETFKNQSSDILLNTFDYGMLKTEILGRISTDEYNNLLELSARIPDLSDNDKGLFRELVGKSGIPYITKERMEHLFLSEIIKAVVKPFDDIVKCFLAIPETYYGGMDVHEVVFTSAGKMIVDLESKHPNIPKQVFALLHQYDDYCYTKKLNHVENDGHKAILNKGLFVLRLIQIMEPAHE